MNDRLADHMPFSKLMGVEVANATPDRIEATLLVRPDLCTMGHILHGGAIMAFADALGGIAAFLNLPEDASGTTTVESKTNFLSPAAEGITVHGTTTAIKIGKQLSVWQTDIARPDGKKVAIVTQTQIILRS